MNGIAIIYERIEAVDGKFVFKPLFVEEGTLDNENLVFSSVKRDYPHVVKNVKEDFFFGNFMSINEINEKYGDNLSIAQYLIVKNEHYATFANHLIIGEAYGDAERLSFGKYIPPTEDKKSGLEELKACMLEYIVAQDDAVKKLAETLHQNIKGGPKKHILITGPHGTGKTTMFQLACECLGVPYYKTSISNNFSVKTKEEIILGLLDMYDNQIAAENGIIYVSDIRSKLELFDADERDLYMEAYERPFIEIMERELVPITWKENKFNFDTSNLTVVIEENFDETITKEAPLAGFVSHQEPEPSPKFGDKRDYRNWIHDDMLKTIKCVVKTKSYELSDINKMVRTSCLSPLVRKADEIKERYNKILEFTESYVDEYSRRVYNGGDGASALDEDPGDLLSSVDEYVESEAQKEHVKSIKLGGKLINNK